MNVLFRFCSITWILCFLCSCASSPSASPRPNISSSDNTIIPGERIGAVYIGMSRADVFKLKGEPKSTGQRTEGIYYEFEDVSVFVNDRTSKVSSITTLSSQHATANGIKVGDSEIAVRTKLGSPSQKKVLDQQYYNYGYFHDSFWIHFHQGKVWMIVVYSR
jgi:hypothetical protein